MTLVTLAPETTGGTVQVLVADVWFPVCDLRLLLPGRGVAALLPDGRQAALFRDRRGGLYAVDNRDPFTGAAVLSRGLTGTHRGRPFVASPLLKQRFDLGTGQCLDDESVRIAVYEVRPVPPAGPTDTGADASTGTGTGTGTGTNLMVHTCE